MSRQVNPAAVDRIPRKRAVFVRLKEALLDRGNVVTWYVPAHHDALEDRARP